jgi:hypothetical protein
VVAGVAVLLLAPRAHWAAVLPRRRRAQELHRQVVVEVQRRALAHLLLSRAALAQLLGRLTAGRCPILQQAAAMMRAQEPERRRVLVLALGRELVQEQRRALQELRPEPLQQPVRLVPEPPQLWARASLQPQVQQRQPEQPRA